MDIDIEPLAQMASARHLGISVRPDGFGFVVIEDAIALDCGVRACDRDQSEDCLGQQFQRIVKMYHPSTVVLLTTGSPLATAKRNSIVSVITKKTNQGNVVLARLRGAAVRRYFRQFDAGTKYEIAQTVVKILPELGWRLPQKRKPWQSEQRRLSIFDAAAAVIAHARLKQDFQI
jgi:hypothetical protein